MTALLAILGGTAGLIVGWVATAAAFIFFGELAGVSNFEGAYAMGAVFSIGPMGGFVGLVIGVWLVIRSRRKKTAQSQIAP